MARSIIVMGVSGSGKTTIGENLAKELNLSFYDADHFHPTSNIEKMKAGTPLNDADRYPWLKRLSGELEKWQKEGGAVLACSALKEEYRKLLSERTHVEWVFLSADFDTIYNRMKNRNHFMKAEMLKSQFDTLEVPAYGIHIEANESPREITMRIIKLLMTNE